jgi:hypothetical protein
MTPTIPYNPRAWFWQVGSDTTRYWSTSIGAYVDAAHIASWVASGGVPARIGSELELNDVLRPAGLAIPVVTAFDVNTERDRRMALFTFDGRYYDLDNQALANVSGSGTLALAAIGNGAQVGDLRWADPNEDFTWITHDNVIVPMDAQTCWAFAQAAAMWRKHCIYKARALKDTNPIPASFAADNYWV